MTEIFDELFAKFDGALADNTIRAYRADLNDYQYWCRANGVEPVSPSPDDMVAYCQHLAETRATATLMRRLASLSSLFGMAGLVDPTRHIDVKLALKRIFRKKGRAQEQAEPLTRDRLHKMIAVCGDDNQGLRDQVLLRLGNETMRRRSELCRFRFDDLEWHPSGDLAINMRFSKTDQFGRGKLIRLSPQMQELLARWEARLGKDDNGYILRGVKHGGEVTPSLSPASINRILVRLQQRAGLKLPGNFSGHSFRVGAALDMLNDGIPIEKIMLKGGWNSESMVIRYLRAWED